MNTILVKIKHNLFKLQKLNNDIFNLQKYKNQINNLNIKNSILLTVVLKIVVQSETIIFKRQYVLQIPLGQILYFNKVNNNILDIILYNIIIVKVILTQLNDRYGISIMIILQLHYTIL
ncbi:hypothetical protein RJT54_00285 [Buchnera aphidicola (Takecallis taiwana)]|uniref:hypothetical protein n=1 Tax=Buchnera aphidicola TaxID=9 RepID=UPI0031B6AD00